MRVIIHLSSVCLSECLVLRVQGCRTQGETEVHSKNLGNLDFALCEEDIDEEVFAKNMASKLTVRKTSTSTPEAPGKKRNSTDSHGYESSDGSSSSD